MEAVADAREQRRTPALPLPKAAVVDAEVVEGVAAEAEEEAVAGFYSPANIPFA